MADNYKKSGVDVAAGDALVDWLVDQKASNIFKDRIVSGVGGFAALFRGDFKEMKNPLLVSSTDGVGTKVKLAVHYNDYSTVGQDLVGMCVNDVLCVGATPLFFLDYYACSKLDLKNAQSFLKGVKAACEEAECALIGGETAEMPGVYHGDDFDCAGFVVGVVDEAEVLGAKRVQKGDLLLGISSSGFHSNGYSLLRRVFENDIDQWREELMKPTRLYSKMVKAAVKVKAFEALAHITGGGLDNVLRVVPPGSILEMKKWKFPRGFLEVQTRAKMTDEEMLVTLNCGFGMIAIIRPENKAKAEQVVSAAGFTSEIIGTVKELGSEGMTQESQWLWPKS